MLIPTAALRALVLAACLASGAAPGAYAHDQDKGPNGGQVVEVKGHHVELTVKGSEIILHLSDKDHAPIASKGATGRVVVLVGGKQTTVELVAVEPNLLTAKPDAPLGPGARIVVSTRLSDGHEILARFVLK